MSHNYLIDDTIAFVLAFGSVGMAQMVWEQFQNNSPNSSSRSSTASKDGSKKKTSTPFENSLVYGVVHSLAVSARVYLLLIVLEQFFSRFPAVLSIIFTKMVDKDGDGVADDDGRVDLAQAAPSVAWSTWLGMTVSTVKRLVLMQAIAGQKLGRVTLLDRLADFIIFLVTVMTILDRLQINMSVGLQSVLSAGGMGALVFSLASKGLAEQLVGGLALGAWDGFKVGDKVRLQDGTEGIIKVIGLLDTQVQGFDNVVQRIPNSQLSFARVSNLSRVEQSRLVQNIRFRYSDLDKLPAVLQEIKQEIRKACPDLVDDGSKAFHAVLVQYEVDHIQGMVMAHFNIKPLTAEFTNNRQEFVLAIARAMKKHNVDFALPSIVYCGENKPM